IFFTILTGVYVIFLVAVPLWWRGVRTATFDVLLLLAITIVATEAIKYLVDRPRPCDALANVNTLAGYRCSAEFDPAFPSGHASRAFAVAAFLTIRFRWRLGIPAGAFAVLAGISRVYLGLHWPSDVLGGAAVGIGFALLIEVVSRRVAPYQRIRAPSKVAAIVAKLSTCASSGRTHATGTPDRETIADIRASVRALNS